MLRIHEREGRQWEVPAGATAGGFVEAGTYIVQIDSTAVNVLVDDVPLERQPGHDAYLWRPGFYAGRVRAEILDERGRVLAECSLDVGPSPDKLGQQQFLQMVDEILATKPHLLVGDGASWSEFGQEGDAPLPEVAYARLRRYGPALLAALRDLCASPLMRLHQQRSMVMPHQARRLDAVTVKDLARSRLAGQVLGLEAPSSDYPTRISVPYVEHTFDHAANRAIAVMVDRLIAQTVGLHRHFSSPIAEVDDPVVLKVPRRLHILGELHDALLRLRNSPALSAVTRPEITAAGLNAISAQPSYARAFQLAWKALKTGILGSEQSDPLSFVAFFLVPAFRHRSRLARVVRELESPAMTNERIPDQLAQVFAGDEYLGHVWNEYRKTLYDAMPASAGVVTPEWRSTVAAEAFWNGPLVVESRVHAEFFKHVPGIFTGLGIIGTFLGLIDGLHKFQVPAQAVAAANQNSVAQQAQASLASLMHSVGEAFVISAAAIGAAMVVTFLEKLLLNSLNSKVDKIAQLLDQKFAATAPEKFLEQSAFHAEEAATQLKKLKGELLKDLTPILYELSDKQSQMLERLAQSFQERIAETSRNQIEASRDNSAALANSIAGAITDGLAGPLDEIKDAVKQASGDQSSSAITMLQDVMTHFSQKINDLFGGQINGINELNQRTAQTMQDAVSKLDDLVNSLQEAGRSSSASMAEQIARAISEMEARQATITQSTQALVTELKSAIEQGQAATSAGVKNSSEEMARRMAEAIEKMEQRQDSINERTREFVEQIRVLVASSQSDTSSKVQEMLQSLGEQLGTMLGQFQSAQQAALDAGREREANAADRTQMAVNVMAGTVESIVQQVADASARMQESVATLSATSTSAISGLTDGASLVNSAARSFTQASDKVSNAMGQAATLTTRLSELTSNVTEASTALQQGIVDYRAHREAVTRLVTELNNLVNNAKTDVSITSNVLQRIEHAASKLAMAQVETEKFMNGVAAVLAKAHEEFRVSVSNSLSKSNHDFQQKLASAVGMLGSSIKELDDVLATATPVRARA
ncbi:conserved hypothetical protein [Cupriavidus taiwanensis]|nr:conserved hypothetical protein [Cupriavidus taiwanensis]